MSLPVNARISSATVSSVASAVTTQTIAAANDNRTQLCVFNDSTANCFLKFGSAASTSSYTIKIAAGGYYEVAGGSTVYSGIVTAVWDAVNGSARVTEF